LDRALKLIALVGRQGDDDGVFLGASELRRVIVRIVEDRTKEFLLAHCTTIVLLVVQVTSTVSGETPHRSFDGSTVDICPVQESYFQFEIQKT